MPWTRQLTITEKELIHHLLSQQNACIITPNERLATRLRHEIAQQLNIKQDQDIEQDQAPNLPEVTSLNAWLRHLWQTARFKAQLTGLELVESPVCLLSQAQVMQLWRRVIQDSPLAESALNPAGLAHLACDAYESLQSACVPESAFASFLEGDSSTFLSWLQGFKTCLKERKALAEADLIGWLNRQPLAVLMKHSRCYWVGFHDLALRERAFIERLQQDCGIDCIKVHLQVSDSRCYLAKAQEPDTEFQAAIRWALSHLESSGEHTRIAVVVPELNRYRHRFKRFLENLPVNLSGGEALSELPMVQAALLILKLVLLPHKASVREISVLLRSPFIKGFAVETQERLMLSSELTQNLLPAMTAVQGLHWLERHAKHKSVQWLTLLQEARQLVSYGQKINLRCWRQTFLQLWNVWQWPGEASLSSQEYQCLEKFQDALDEFAALEPENEILNMNEAVHLLEFSLKNTLFQVKSEALPIQVLGLLEASDQTFDYLWITGLTQEYWPQPTRLHPFIPKEIQRKYQTRRALPEKELAIAQLMTNAFSHAAREVIFSWPQSSEGRAHLPSDLIAGFSAYEWVEPAVQPDLKIESVNLESFADEQGPVLESGQSIKGGTGLLKSQAQCPFRAFAQYRLRVRRREQPVLGLNARIKGECVHGVLEKFWKQVRTHQALCALPDPELEQKVFEAVVQVLYDLAQIWEQPLGASMQEAEKQRLKTLIVHWLMMEKLRVPFEVIAVEKLQEVVINGMRLKLRADRVDRLASGEMLVIDYKTGLATINEWFDERLTAPQLLLYCIISEETVNGIAFGLVRQDKPCLRGVAREGMQVYETKPGSRDSVETQFDWPDTVSRWRRDLEKLVEEFKTGVASVTPSGGGAVCQNCGLQGLCRVYEGPPI